MPFACEEFVLDVVAVPDEIVDETVDAIVDAAVAPVVDVDVAEAVARQCRRAKYSSSH